MNNAFRKQETHCQLFVVSGGAHRHGDAALLTVINGAETEPNFKRFLNGE
ncbi:hypothetical protein GCM10028825_24240 [Spirosoma agri]